MFNWLKKVWNCLFGDNTPTNLIEALDVLDRILSEQDKIIISLRTELEVCVQLHHSLGRYLRNNWGLWDMSSPLYKWFKAHGVWHTDDMSSIIIRSYYRKTNGRPIELQEQVQEYVEYWKGVTASVDTTLRTPKGERVMLSEFGPILRDIRDSNE